MLVNKAHLHQLKNYWIPILSNYPNFKQKKIIIIGNKNDLQKEVTIQQININEITNIIQYILLFSKK